MFDLLFSRTFLIVGGMLIITAFAARINKAFETKTEARITILGTFILLFVTQYFADQFPLNLLMVGLFSGLIGWQIWPAIEMYGDRYKLNQYLQSRGIKLKKWEKLPKEHEEDFKEFLTTYPPSDPWSHIISQAIFATAMAVFAMAWLVYMTSIDFSIYGGFLLIALIILIIMGLVNIFIYRSKIFSLIRVYFGVIIFMGYLLYDFSVLTNRAWDDSRATAINISVNIYLDIINLFLYILDILGSSD